ncbi:hypothetical protein COCSUDRAFT_32544 [Coccomyxa subellipsoidea C-169]|uniref:Uncharacterized protein n=1 Tax=Coccomyxa subellipsoidea (strain C-169) TaxID=574566 RepID=I0Z325_COCSC|nr:hypothetical protein COCSUDRAFT_32544 [Coccomyxa subellipsoidea C-169]EIE25044.1 hypothetical protein COCSUDRAFT_32544 [Coccomyxa subellipsoidea C-169]|eukprot:XP_005649588.1 hypothetical protein COCSUDRAFT_32544 [Coccomyxa subellipsoidea C-169]
MHAQEFRHQIKPCNNPKTSSQSCCLQGSSPHTDAQKATTSSLAYLGLDCRGMTFAVSGLS